MQWENLDLGWSSDFPSVVNGFITRIQGFPFVVHGSVQLEGVSRGGDNGLAWMSEAGEPDDSVEQQGAGDSIGLKPPSEFSAFCAAGFLAQDETSAARL